MASITLIPDYVQQFTQKQQVLWYLDYYGSITSLEAINAFTLTRLAAIIQFLEEDGYVFDPRPETSPDTGKTYTRYFHARQQEELF